LKVTVRTNIDLLMVRAFRTLDWIRQRFFVARENWPVAAGRYYIGRRDRPVAISTLGSVELMEKIGRREEFAIIGKAFTENIGIEKIVQNIVSNPAIRFLLVCGPESRHKVGQSLIALKQSGVDPDGRIVGSLGKIPILKNLRREQIIRFQEQVEIVDLIGEQRVETIMAKVAELNNRNPSPFQGESTPQLDKTEHVSSWHRESLDYHADAAGFFVIQIDRRASEIVVEHYNTSCQLLRALHGKKAIDIYSTMIRNGWVTLLGHAAYLGRELAMAEFALVHGWNYEQNQGVKPDPR
jgi:tetrahydromethanopterin S-methyltransferase subunit A